MSGLVRNVAIAAGLGSFWREFRDLCSFARTVLQLLRDTLWTIVFFRCAVTVASWASGHVVDRKGVVVRARVLGRVNGKLLVTVDKRDPLYQNIYAELLEVLFTDRGIAWAVGHDGDEVDALTAVVALS